MNSEPYVVKFKKSFSQTNLIDSEGKFIQNVSVNDALKLASDVGVDLVCFNEPEKDKPAFCKILDYGKWKYWQEKHRRKEHSKEHKKETKEIRLSVNIDIGDINRKVKKCMEILNENDDVLFTMKLHGRERIHMKEAIEKMNYVVSLCTPNVKEASRKVVDGYISVRLQKAG